MKNGLKIIAFLAVFGVVGTLIYFLVQQGISKKRDGVKPPPEPLPPPKDATPPPNNAKMYDPLTDGKAIIQNRVFELHQSNAGQNIISSEGLGSKVNLFKNLTDANAYDASINEAFLKFYPEGNASFTSFNEFLGKVKQAKKVETLDFDGLNYIWPTGESIYKNTDGEQDSKTRKSKLATGEISYLKDAGLFAGNVQSENERYNALLKAAAIASLRAAGWRFIGYDI